MPSINVKGGDIFLVLKPCENPFCNCGNSNVSFQKNSVLDEKSIDKDLVINHFDKSIELFDPLSRWNDEETHTTSKSLSFLEEQFTDLDWKSIQEEYLFLKQQLIENYNPYDSLHSYSFKKNQLENPSLMEFFIDIHPDAHVLEITHHGKTYELLDQYCKLSNCPCSTISISVMEKDSSSDELFYFKYDYKTGKIDDKSKQWVLDVLFRDKPIQYFNDLFANRSKKIKDLYLLNLKENAKSKTIKKKSVKIGRNEKCPCGSGLKYKKCCINK